MRLLSAIIIWGIALTSTTAQTTTTPSLAAELLERIDADAGALMAETNTGRLDYNMQMWIEHAQKVADAVTDSMLWAYEYKHIRVAHVADTAAVLYFCPRIGNRGLAAWLTTLPTMAGRKAYAFCDRLKDDKTRDHTAYDSLRIEAQTSGSHVGFAVRNKADHAMLTVGDIGLRLCFEIVADIGAERELKDQALKVIDQRLSSILKGQEGLSADLSYLPRLMSVGNEQQTVRIVTYMATYSDFSSQCYGHIVFESEKGIISRRLIDKTDDIRSPEKNSKLSDKKWYGAVYSRLVEVKFNKRTYYTLIGYKGTDGLVKTRVVDLLTLAGDKCIFGSPLFEHEKATYSRRIFRYSANANMMIRYDDKLRKLVFDHLSPSNTMFVGEYRTYGPDFSYDAYRLTKTGWEFESDVEVKNN